MRNSGITLVFILLAGCGKVAGSPVGDASVTATMFHTLSVSKVGIGMGSVSSTGGEIACGSTCAAMVQVGTTVTLTATADATSTFVGWSGGNCAGTGQCMVTVNADTTVTGEFAPITQDPCSGSLTFDFMPGTVQTFLPPACATHLVIDASGAQGGGTFGGKGARIVGTFPVTGMLRVLVGAQGSTVTNISAGACSGGGGGSFVYMNATDAMPLIAAAGGGGGSPLSSGIPGGPGSADATPTDSVGGGGNAAGGVAGGGGAGGTETGAPGVPGTGGGGTGWLGNGANGMVDAKAGGGAAPRNGGAGGAAGIGTGGIVVGVPGGFGGGGGAAGSAGASGGGGGFNGGGGGNGFTGRDWGSGGGGGSFNAGTNPTVMSGARMGNGVVIISWQ
jgi:hypothetical protein